MIFTASRLLPLGGETRLPWTPAIQLALDLLLVERNTWRAAIDDTADSGPVAFPEARKPEKVAEVLNDMAVPRVFGLVTCAPAPVIERRINVILSKQHFISFRFAVGSACAELTCTSLDES